MTLYFIWYVSFKKPSILFNLCMVVSIRMKEDCYYEDISGRSFNCLEKIWAFYKTFLHNWKSNDCPFSEQDPAHSCCFYPDASVVAIGTETGRWLVLDCETHEIVTSHTDGNEQIECVLYSPGNITWMLKSLNKILWKNMIALDTIKFNATLRSVLLKICFCFFTDGKYLALGSRDNHVYIYEVSEGAKKYSRLGRCSVRYFPKS